MRNLFLLNKRKKVKATQRFIFLFNFCGLHLVVGYQTNANKRVSNSNNNAHHYRLEFMVFPFPHHYKSHNDFLMMMMDIIDVDA